MAAKKKTAKKETVKVAELTLEQAQELLVIQKETVKALRKPIKSIRMKHKCMKAGSVPDDPKVAKELAKAEKALAPAVQRLQEIKDRILELKPKGERKVGKTKYTYPEGMSDAEKKKYRAKMRREAKEGAEDGEPKEAKEKAPKAKKAKASKKSKKVSDEDIAEATKAVKKAAKGSKKKAAKKAAPAEDD